MIEADRWRQAQGNAPADQIAAGAKAQNWDPSVKALTAFPTVLAQMDKNIQWTTDLGNAYYNQPQDVMDSVQAMRQKAQAAGQLHSTPQLTVNNDNGVIVIAPANPAVVYVPVYNPWVVYGAPIAAYPGFYWAPPPEIVWGGRRSALEWELDGRFAGWGWGWGHWGVGWMTTPSSITMAGTSPTIPAVTGMAESMLGAAVMPGAATEHAGATDAVGDSIAAELTQAAEAEVSNRGGGGPGRRLRTRWTSARGGSYGRGGASRSTATRTGVGTSHASASARSGAGRTTTTRASSGRATTPRTTGGAGHSTMARSGGGHTSSGTSHASASAQPAAAAMRGVAAARRTPWLAMPAVVVDIPLVVAVMRWAADTPAEGADMPAAVADIRNKARGGMETIDEPRVRRHRVRRTQENNSSLRKYIATLGSLEPPGAWSVASPGNRKPTGACTA